MVKEALPRESESQQIGHLACLALEATHPTSWRIQESTILSRAACPVRSMKTKLNVYFLTGIYPVRKKALLSNGVYKKNPPPKR